MDYIYIYIDQVVITIPMRRTPSLLYICILFYLRLGVSPHNNYNVAW